MEPLSMIAPDNIKAIGNSIPFMLAAGSDPRINKTRMMEALIQALVIGAIVASAGYYIAFPVLQNEVANIRRDVSDTKEAMKEAVREIKTYQEGRRTLRDSQQERTDARINQIQIDIARMKR